jgi:hypothetical protein
MSLRARVACARRRPAKRLPEMQISTMGQAKIRAEDCALNRIPDHRYTDKW